jgi:hypothetical protein
MNVNLLKIYEDAIIKIMDKMGLDEIELPKKYITNNEFIEIAENPANNSILVRKVKDENKDEN